MRIPVIRTSHAQTYLDAHFDITRNSELTAVLREVEFVDHDPAQSVARQWNEQLLEAIRNDVSRPTVHARNLFHASVAMYDAWAAYDDSASRYTLGNRLHDFTCPFAGLPPTRQPEADRITAISYAAYRLLDYRFAHSPSAARTRNGFRNLMLAHGFDPAYDSTHYSNGDAAALGNYIAQCIIDYGARDGSNEDGNYASLAYTAANPPLAPMLPGSQHARDPNRWQPLSFKVIGDDTGPISYQEIPSFLSPEWGTVIPFALDEDDFSVGQRAGHEYWVYHDPGTSPRLDAADPDSLTEEYLWNFALVALWSSHLDPGDGVLWDISPGSIGNLQDYPEDVHQYRQFYDMAGGDPSRGHDINPFTGKPYEPQIVPRADYARVLAEFWADGPNSETPPGHWFPAATAVSGAHTDHFTLIASGSWL